MIAPEAILARVKELPTLSQVTVRLRQLLSDRKSGAAEFEQVIRPDPALTANLLRIANSAYFGVRSRVESVRQAVTLLGVKRVYEIASAAALAPAVPRRLPGYEIDAAGFWLHCVGVAVLSERLARELKLAMPDLTFTAGLLHDVGKLVVGTFVGGASDEILARVRGGRAFASAEREVLGTDHCEVAAALADAWKLPPTVGAVVRWHHAPPREGPDSLIIGLVHAADGLAHVMGLGTDAGELARTMDAGAAERLGIRARRLEHVASESLDEIREMAAVFAPPAGGTR